MVWALSGVLDGIVGGVVVLLVVIAVLAFRRSHMMHQTLTLTIAGPTNEDSSCRLFSCCHCCRWRRRQGNENLRSKGL